MQRVTDQTKKSQQMPMLNLQVSRICSFTLAQKQHVVNVERPLLHRTGNGEQELAK